MIYKVHKLLSQDLHVLHVLQDLLVLLYYKYYKIYMHNRSTCVNESISTHSSLS